VQRIAQLTGMPPGERENAALQLHELEFSKTNHFQGRIQVLPLRRLGQEGKHLRPRLCVTDWYASWRGPELDFQEFKFAKLQAAFSSAFASAPRVLMARPLSLIVAATVRAPVAAAT
jgi:hypothetical protein